jgi:outer membrane protein W
VETPADTRPRGPIRAQRRLALTGEIGWNGLAGFGPVLTYHVHPHFSTELGLGLSLTGWKAGVRARYNLLTSAVTPFVGVGFNATTGLGEVTANAADDPNRDPERDPVTMNIKASHFVQGVVGIDYVHRRGFTLIGCVGYSRLLNDNNVEILAGSLTNEEERGFEIAFKSGPVITVGVGYSFQ